MLELGLSHVSRDQTQVPRLGSRHLHYLSRPWLDSKVPMYRQDGGGGQDKIKAQSGRRQLGLWHVYWKAILGPHPPLFLGSYSVV